MRFLFFIFAFSLFLNQVSAQVELKETIDFGKDSLAFSKVLVQSPVFDRDRTELFEFFRKNVEYSVFNTEYELDGTVWLSFIIKPNGALDSLKVLQETGFGFENEALRVLKLTDGKWTPGKINGELAKFKYKLPISFNRYGLRSLTTASIGLLDEEFEKYKKTEVYKLELEGKYEEARKIARKLDVASTLKPTWKQVLKTEKENAELMEKARRSGILAQAQAANDYYNKGISAYEAGKLEEAKELFTTAIELKTDHFPAWQNRGVTKYKLQDLKGACADWQQIVKLGGTLPEFLTKLCN